MSTLRDAGVSALQLSYGYSSETDQVRFSVQKLYIEQNTGEREVCVLDIMKNPLASPVPSHLALQVARGYFHAEWNPQVKEEKMRIDRAIEHVLMGRTRDPESVIDFDFIRQNASRNRAANELGGLVKFDLATRALTALNEIGQPTIKKSMRLH